jgi:signal transduction histidine kinase
MTRLYIRNLILFTLIFILLTIGVYTLYRSLMTNYFSTKNENTVDAHILNVLDSELAKYPQKEWNTLLKKIAPRFKSSANIHIVKTASLTKNIKSNQQFQNGKVKFIYRHPVVAGSFLSLYITSYKKVTSNSNYTIQLNTGLDIVDTINTKSQWLASYLYSTLQNKPMTNWKPIISKLLTNKLYGLKIYTIKPSSLPKWVQEKLKVTDSITFDSLYFKNNILNHPDSKPYQYIENLSLKEQILDMLYTTPTFTLAMQSPDKNHILIISHLYSEGSQFTRVTPFLLILFLVLIILSWLWTFPLYKGIKRLQLLASAYSQGEFIYDIKLNKHFSLYPLYQSLVAMGQQIDRTMNNHKDLANAISHELRHPLSRMRFSLEMIEETKENSLYIKKIKKDITEQDNLLDELLTYAKYNHKNTEIILEKVEFGLLVDRFISGFEHDYPNKSYNYINKLIGMKLYSYIDIKLIERALQNILVNAYKYSKESISISLEFNNYKYIILTIEDDGPGISIKRKHRIFEPFAQADRSKANSYGLGLAIAKGIVNSHEGSIMVENNSPLGLGGASFIIKIPIIIDDI